MNVSPLPTLQWQPEKRLQSGDKLWILTDTFSEWRAFRGDARPQQWFRVGAYDLTTRKIGYFRFSIDDARGLLRAGITPPPWQSPQVHGVLVKRMAHQGQEKGRFKVEVSLVALEPEVLSLAAPAIKAFARDGHWSNSTSGMWKDVAARVSLDLEIEQAALKMVGRFSAGDLRGALGKEVNVGPVLARLVEEERLLPFGKKKGARYEVAPPKIVERVDWVG